MKIYMAYHFFIGLALIWSHLFALVVTKLHRKNRDFESTSVNKFRLVSMDSEEMRMISFPIKNLGDQDPFYANLTTFSLGVLAPESLRQEISGLKKNDTVIQNFCSIKPMTPEITTLQQNNSNSTLLGLKSLITNEEIYIFYPEKSRLDIFTISEQDKEPLNFETSLYIEGLEGQNCFLLRNNNNLNVYLVTDSKIVVIGLINIHHNQTVDEDETNPEGDNVEFYNSEGQKLNQSMENNVTYYTVYGLIKTLEFNSKGIHQQSAGRLDAAFFSKDCFFMKFIYNDELGKEMAALRVFCFEYNYSSLTIKEERSINTETKILLRNDQILLADPNRIEVVNIDSINVPAWEKDSKNLIFFEKINKTLIVAERESSEYGPIIAVHEYHFNSSDTPQGPPQHVRGYKFPSLIESKDLFITKDFLIVYQINMIKIIRHSIPSIFRDDNHLISAQLTENMVKIESNLETNIMLMIYPEKIILGSLRTPSVNLECSSQGITLGHYFLELDVFSRQCPNSASSFCSFKAATMIQVEKIIEREGSLYSKDMFFYLILVIVVIILFSGFIILTFVVKYQRVHREYKRLKSLFDSEMVSGSHID